MKKWIIAIGGFLLSVGLLILGRDGRALKKVEERKTDELAGGSKDAMFRAEKLNEKAEKHKANAALAAEKTKTVLEARSEKDPVMADLLSEYDARRVRK